MNISSMKNLLYIMLLVIASACSDNKTDDMNIDSGTLPEQWVLVQMSGQTPNSTTTGDNMEWQEYYVFNDDLTFTKVRTRDGKELQASGTYVLQTINNENHFVLQYLAANGLIGSCTGGASETLWLKSADKMSSNWQQCDGPGLDYELRTSITH